MNKTDNILFRALNKINIGFFVVFLGFWVLGLNSDSLNLISLTAWLLIMILPLLLVVSGIRQLKPYRAQLKPDKKTRALTYSILALNITGFIVMGISVYLVAIYSMDPTLSPDYRFIPHPYQFQALILLLAGFFIESLAFWMYRYLLPKSLTSTNVTAETGEEPKSSLSQKQA